MISILNEAIESINALQDLMKDQYELLAIGPDKQNRSLVDIFFFTAASLILRRMEGTHLFFALKKCSNLICIAEKFFDLHINPRREYVNFSINMNDANLRMLNELLTSSRRLNRSPVSPVFECSVGNPNFFGVPVGKVAIKRFSEDNPYNFYFYMMEALYLKEIQHAHIVKLLGFVEVEGMHLLVFPYYSNGDLSTITSAPMLPLKRTLEIIIDMCRGLLMLHAHGYVFDDFKPQNFILDGDKVMLGDLGGIKPFGEKLTFMSQPYLEPFGYGHSVIDHKSAQPASDVYKIGVFAVHLMTIVSIHQGNDYQNLLGIVSNRFESEELTDFIRREICNSENVMDEDIKQIVRLILRCLAVERDNRPYLYEVINALVEIYDRIQQREGEGSSTSGAVNLA